MTLRISVRGSAERTFPAESAAVPVQISVEAGSRDDAYLKAAAIQSELAAALEDFAAAGGVRTWSSDQVRAHTWRDKLRTRHEARVGARAEFVTVEALERFADAWVPREGVTLGWIHWDLTPDNRRAREAEVRRDAVADAVAKAADYAEALGFPAPTPVHVADAGMREPGFAPYGRQAMAMESAAGGAPDQPAISLVPEEIRIEVTVEAEFAAG